MLNIPPVLFVGGKGGVGKSSISSALALGAALNGKKTLLISTDPAHNLGDIFALNLSSGEIKKAQIQLDIESKKVELYLLEINPQKESHFYTQEAKNRALAFINKDSISMLEKYYHSVEHSASAQESALFERLIEIVVENDNILSKEKQEQKLQDSIESDKMNLKYDQIIIDTAPTGHTLRLFSLPKIMQEWSEVLLKQSAKKDSAEQILGAISKQTRTSSLREVLEIRKLRYLRFLNILKEPQNCGIAFVLNPEFLSINETTRAIEELKADEVVLFGLFVNKVPPKSDDPFFAARFKQAEQNLAQIFSQFENENLYLLPLQKNDINTQKALFELLDSIESK